MLLLFFFCLLLIFDNWQLMFRKGGAFGSRLTGAGWGGCTVSLVPQERSEAFFKHVRDEYYAKYVPSALKNINDVLFATTPGQGAFIYEPISP
jgi:galactokinase